MKKITTYYVTHMMIIFSSLTLIPSVHADDLNGADIIKEATTRHNRDIEFENQIMVLKKGNVTEEERVVRRYSRKDKSGYKYLMAFDNPPGVKGVALLTWENIDGPDDQFLYLPSMNGKLKRIAESGKRSYFMGTDFTYEDLMIESRDKFKYERMPDVTFDGKPAYQVNAVPVDKTIMSTTGYKSRTMTILKGNFFVAKTVYYDRRGRLLKQLTSADITQVEGMAWRAKKQIMENFKNKHVTEVYVKERSFKDRDVPAKLFTQRHIKNGNHIN